MVPTKTKIQEERRREITQKHGPSEAISTTLILLPRKEQGMVTKSRVTCTKVRESGIVLYTILWITYYAISIVT